MGVFGTAFGALQAPYGPELYAGAPWPTPQTPSGFGAPDLSVPDRYLEHYLTSFNPDGSAPSSGIRSFRYPATPPRPYIYEGLDSPVVYSDPAKNGSVCSWTTLNRLDGAIWIDLGTKHGVIFAAAMVGSPVSDPSSKQAAHMWYMNAGVNPTCRHGFTVPDVPNIAGPVTTAAFPAFIIYDPDQLREVKAGTRTDYLTSPADMIDLQTAFGVKTPSPLMVGGCRNVRGFHFDASRNLLFVLSAQADDALPNYYQPLVHVFEVKP
jgi:hypothetical protein